MQAPAAVSVTTETDPTGQAGSQKGSGAQGSSSSAVEEGEGGSVGSGTIAASLKAGAARVSSGGRGRTMVADRAPELRYSPETVKDLRICIVSSN